MSTVTGDFAVNFTGLSNVDPYTNANLTKLGTDSVKILSAAIKNSGFSNGTFYRYNGSMSTTATLRAKIEVGTNGTSGDRIYIFLLTSGGNGYWARIEGTALVLWRITAFAGDLSIATATLGSAPASGDQLVLELNQSTHVLTAYVNGVSKASGTDSTYTSGLAFGFGFESNNGNASTALSFAGDGVTPSGPTISSISTLTHLGTATITGTNFPTSQSGSASVVIGGQAQIVTWNTSTQATITVDAGNNAFLTNVNAVVTDAAGNASANFVCQFSPRSGGAAVTLSGTLASSGLGIEASPALAAGNQIEYYGAVGGTIPADVTVNVDRTYDAASGVTGFYWRAFDGAWGTPAFETVTHAEDGRLIKTMLSPLLKTMLETH